MWSILCDNEHNYVDFINNRRSSGQCLNLNDSLKPLRFYSFTSIYLSVI